MNELKTVFIVKYIEDGSIHAVYHNKVDAQDKVYGSELLEIDEWPVY